MLKDKDKKLNRLTMKHIIFIITYTIALVWVILHIDQVMGTLQMIINLLKPFIYGIMMAFVFNLPMKYFMKKLPASLGKGKRAVAALLSLIIIIGVITFIFWIVMPQVIHSVTTLANALPGYLEEVQKNIQTAIENKQIPEEVLNQIETYAMDIQKMAVNIVKNGLPHLIDMASGFASSIANIFMALVIAVYLTISKNRLITQAKEFLYAFTSKRVNEYLLKVAHLTNVTFANFVTGQLVEAIIIGILCYIGCLILQFPYAPILSVIIGCTNIIPIFGAIFGVGLSALLVAFVDPLQGIFFILFGICLQQFESNLIYPRVVGNTVGLSGLWVLFAITVGGGFFGFAGMLLGLPIFSIIYALLREEMHRRSSLKRQSDEGEKSKQPLPKQAS